MKLCIDSVYIEYSQSLPLTHKLAEQTLTTHLLLDHSTTASRLIDDNFQSSHLLQTSTSQNSCVIFFFSIICLMAIFHCFTVKSMDFLCQNTLLVINLENLDDEFMSSFKKTLATLLSKLYVLLMKLVEKLRVKMQSSLTLTMLRLLHFLWQIFMNPKSVNLLKLVGKFQNTARSCFSALLRLQITMCPRTYYHNEQKVLFVIFYFRSNPQNWVCDIFDDDSHSFYHDFKAFKQALNILYFDCNFKHYARDRLFCLK